MASTVRRTGTPHTNKPEDTAQQRARLLQEQQLEQNARAGELSMATARAGANDADGVWDPQTGALLEEGLSDDQVAEMERQGQITTGDRDAVIEESRRLVTGRANTPAEALIGPTGVPIRTRQEAAVDDAVLPAMTSDTQFRVGPGPNGVEVEPGFVPAAQPKGPDMTMVVHRVNADLETTIGAGNHYRFQKGRRHRMPRFVAEHLAEKNYLSDY